MRSLFRLPKISIGFHGFQRSGHPFFLAQDWSPPSKIVVVVQALPAFGIPLSLREVGSHRVPVAITSRCHVAGMVGLSWRIRDRSESWSESSFTSSKCYKKMWKPLRFVDHVPAKTTGVTDLIISVCVYARRAFRKIGVVAVFFQDLKNDVDGKSIDGWSMGGESLIAHPQSSHTVHTDGTSMGVSYGNGGPIIWGCHKLLSIINSTNWLTSVHWGFVTSTVHLVRWLYDVQFLNMVVFQLTNCQMSRR